MATLELSIDEDVAVSPVKRTRRLGPLFWAAIAWIILIFAAAGLVGVLPLPSPTDMDMLERRAPASAPPRLRPPGVGGGGIGPRFFFARGAPPFWVFAPRLCASVRRVVPAVSRCFR